MRDRLRVLLAPLRWRLNGGTELDAIPTSYSQPGGYEAGDGQVRALVATCLHSPGCWSYCTGGYTYCLCCLKVRVRC